MLRLLEVVHTLMTLLPYLLDKLLDLHTNNMSLQWLQQQHSRMSHWHHQATGRRHCRPQIIRCSGPLIICGRSDGLVFRV